MGSSTRADLTTAAMSALPADRWTVLHDVAWPRRRRASIDHVVVGPPGVLVVTTESCSGDVVLDHGVLMNQGRDRIDALRRSVQAAAAVASSGPAAAGTRARGDLPDRGESPQRLVRVPDRLLDPRAGAGPDGTSRGPHRRAAAIVVSDLRWLLRGAAEAEHLPLSARSQPRAAFSAALTPES